MMKYLFFICLLFITSSVLAKGGLEKLPEVEKMDINVFVGLANKVTKEFSEDPYLNFTMEVPKNFIEKSTKNLKNEMKNEHLYGEIFAADGPASGDFRSYISVRSIKLDRLISAKNWFISQVLKLGYTLRGIESDKKGDAFDAFYIRLGKFGETEIVRGRGFLNGKRLVLVEYVLPRALWSKERDKQIFSMKSFGFSNDIEITSPERIINYSFLDSFSTEYPVGWILSDKKDDGINRIDLSFKTTDINRFVFASADVTVISSRSLRDRIDQTVYSVDLPKVITDIKSKIDEQGYEFDPVKERITYDLQIEHDFQLTEVYPLRKKKSANFVSYDKNPITRELWISVIKSPKEIGKNYIVSMIMPPRDNNMYQWAIATKTFERIVESIR